MPGGEIPLKNDENINKEFKISPSDKVIEEAVLEDDTNSAGGSTEHTANENSAADIDREEQDNGSDETQSDLNPLDEASLESLEDNSLFPASVLEDEARPLFDNNDVYRETDLFGDDETVPNINEDDEDEDENYLDDSDEAQEAIDGDSEDSDADESSDIAEEALNTEDKQTMEKPRRVDTLFDFVELFVFTLAAVFIVTSFFFRYSIVDGGSMENTLHDDEKLILRSIFYTPECGDVVVVQDKSTSLKDPIVKRVIAVGGQTVKFTRDAVYVDGIVLDEPYVYTADYENPFGGEDIYRYSVYPSDALMPLVTDKEDGVFYEITVPDGEIFVMGDHRNNSKDSRDIGTLHEDAVIGKVVLRFLPFSEFGKIE